MVDSTRRQVVKALLGTAAMHSCLVHAASGAAASGTATARPSAADSVIARAHALLVTLNSPDVSAFLTDWPHTSARRGITAQSVPALHWLPTLRAVAAPFSAPLLDALAVSAPLLAWKRGYREADVGADFLENYGWTEFVGLTGAMPGKRLSCGVLLLGPNVTYPPHHHEADEIYIPLAGTAAWKDGDAPWQERKPGAVIHHPPYQSHAMQTAQSPMLALYLWRTDDLSQDTILDSRAAPPLTG